MVFDKYKYLNILKNNLKDNVHKLILLKDFYFQRDNNHKYTV